MIDFCWHAVLQVTSRDESIHVSYNEIFGLVLDHIPLLWSRQWLVLLILLSPHNDFGASIAKSIHWKGIDGSSNL